MSAIAERFPGARELEGRVELEFDGVTYRARVAQQPVGLVSVAVPATDGFELALRWTDRGTAATRAPNFDDSFLVETNELTTRNGGRPAMLYRHGSATLLHPAILRNDTIVKRVPARA